MVISVDLSNTNNVSTENNGNLAKSTEQVAISKDEYISSCAAIPYDEIARNPNNYKGQKTTFKGQVIQMQESGKNVVLRINVSQGEYGIWEDTIYVDYQRKSDTESRILEEDIITIYGEVKGIKDYTAVFGNQISIPHIVAEYIEIDN